MTPGVDRLGTVACIVCLYYPPHSSTLPSLHPIPHPAEDRVNSCLRSFHLVGTQSCAALCFSPGSAGERLKLQPLFSYDSLPPEPVWGWIQAIRESRCATAGRYQSASVLIVCAFVLLWELMRKYIPWALYNYQFVCQCFRVCDNAHARTCVTVYVYRQKRFLCLVPNAKGQSKGAGLD